MNNAEHLRTPWAIGNTGPEQVMFLDADGRYAGAVKIEQTGGGAIAAVDEDRRRACAALILRAVNAYGPLPPDVVELVIAARLAFEHRDQEALDRLDKASEAFADRVPWDDDPTEISESPNVT